MQIRHIELFVAVAEEQHFSRAAQRENIVQSGISAAIRSLEEELGALLFIRSTRRVELSPTGRIFLPEARRILESVRLAKATVAGVQQGLRGRLAIGTIESLTPFLDLPMLLQRFHKMHPKVKLVVHQAHISSLVEGLRDGTLDLAFMQMLPPVSQALSYDPLFSSPMVATHSPEHPLSGRETVTLADIKDEPFIDFSTRWGTRRFVDQLFSQENFERNSNYEVESYDLASQFVKRNFGIAIMPEAMARHRDLPFLRLLPTQSDVSFPLWELGLFRPRSKGELSSNPPAEMFRKLVSQTALLLQ